MTQEEKQLLLKDLSERLPYKTYVKTAKGIGYVYAINTSQLIELSIANDSEYWSEVFNIDKIKPYLRPMSNMTEEEDKEWQYYKNAIAESCDEKLGYKIGALHIWLNSHHFDYRGLIPMGLALETPEGMYK